MTYCDRCSASQRFSTNRTPLRDCDGVRVRPNEIGHPGSRLFVIRDGATLIADASLKGLLDGRLACLGEIEVHRNDASLRRTLDCIENSLAYRIVANLEGSDIHS